MKSTKYNLFHIREHYFYLSAIYGKLDILWFMLLMMWKLIWFDKTLAIPNIRLTTADMIVAFGTLLLILGWTFWLSKRWRTLILLLLNIVLTIIIFADLVYFRYFQDFISIPVLLQAKQVSSLSESIFSLVYITDLWLIIDWLIVFPLSILYFYISPKKNVYPTLRSTWRMRLLQSMLSLIIGTTMLTVPIYQATNTWATGILVGNWWNAAVYNITGLFGFHGYDIYRYTKDNWFHKTTMSQAEMDNIQQWFNNHRPNMVGSPATFGKYKDCNVIIVQVEALENFVIGRSINGQEITPNMNKLLQSSLYFKRFFHQTGQGRTSDADFIVNSSLYPLPTGSVFMRYPNQTYDMIPAILKTAGYTTGAYHAYDAGFWNRYFIYPNMGYDYFMNRTDYKMDEPLGWSLGDKSFFHQSVAHIKKKSLPFYSFLTTLTSHHPYKLPVAEQKLKVTPYQNTIFGDYLQSIHYVDAALGEMIQDLKQRDLWNKTIWIMYGDHDNSIHDREPLAHMLGRKIDEFDMIEMKNQVPLIVHLPDNAQVGTYDTISSQIDIAPTLLHWLGIESKDKYMMGQHLLHPKQRLVVLRNGSFTDGNVFYVPSADGLFEHGVCFDYQTRQPIYIDVCKSLAEKAKQHLALSDLIITRNAIKQLRAKEK